MLEKFTILGVHPVPLDVPCHLIEVLIEGIDFGEIAQECKGEPRDNWPGLLTNQPLRTQTENLANLSTRKGASMDLCTFQKISFKDLDPFRFSTCLLMSIAVYPCR